MLEFRSAHDIVMKGRRKFLIPLKRDRHLVTDNMDLDVRNYLDTYTYIDCGDEVDAEQMWEWLREAWPPVQGHKSTR